jgi:hypothetical protein
MDALTPIMAGSFLAVKRSEYQAFAAQDEDFEIKHHIYTF